GTWTGSVSGQVSATIPTGTALGTGYRIRVVSSDPAVIGTDNGLNIQVSNCNSSLLYDGIDDRVTVPHNNAYNIGSGDFTIEALVNIAAGAGGNLPILSQRTGAFDGFLIYVYGNQLLLQMNGVPNYLSSSFTSIRDGHCHHVAISRSGTAITFYVDGNSVGTAASGRSLNSTGPLYIGYDSYDQSSFDGSINEVRFWNIARSAADIAANATSSLSASSTGLIGLWRFNEAGQTVVDASSVANNGVLGSTTDVEATDPQRSSVACYSGDRYESETVNKVYAASNNWTVDVAPNPFDSEVSITIESASQTDDLYYVEIFNLQGVSLKAQYIHATDHLTLNDNDLKAGIYLMKISQNGNQQTIKLIKR
ncbi:MAG TPA: LamG-like jellyroll fold domain-containing protein, partial [Cytophagaceae bacterium]|nr:LamG-like jellyroll fold domain-containing protein [Cytophagaceae bacterium]